MTAEVVQLKLVDSNQERQRWEMEVGRMFGVIGKECKFRRT